MNVTESELAEKVRVRTRAFLKSAVQSATVGERPKIGILTEVLQEVFGPLGFKIVPPIHFLSEKREKKESVDSKSE